MKRLKVMTVVGTRPEVIRLSRVIPKLDAHCDHVLVHTGQNHDYELNQIFFDELGLRAPDHFLGAAGSPAETIAAIITRTDRLLEEHAPEAFLVLGDTNSCLSVIAAKRRRVPIFHMEAGNRCFDARVPEETNRRIVDHTADVNLTYSAIAREYLLREGLAPDLVIKTGSPMAEVLSHNRERIASSGILARLGLEKDGYFAVSAHREENVDPPKSLLKLAAILNALAAEYRQPVVVTTHPRTRKRIEEARIEFHEQVRLLRPLGFHDYVHLQMNARAVLSDSGTISEESSILGFPALNLREAHERPEAMEEAAVMMVGLDLDRVRQALSILDAAGPRQPVLQVDDYAATNVSDKVLRIIYSYTDYVRRVVWRAYD